MLAPEWIQVLDGIGDENPVLERGEDWIRVGWPREQPEQVVDVNILPVQGLVRILIAAEVCEARDVSYRAALELAEKLLVGGLLVRKNVLALRLVLTQGHYTMPLIRSTIAILRENAIWLRQELVKARTSVAGGLDQGRY